MVYEHSLQRYRNWYALLLRLYSKAYYERFGEGMKQTFSDLLRERAEKNKGVAGFVVWVFFETLAEIIKNNTLFIFMHHKNIFRIVLVTLCLLLIPLIGNIVSSEWQWGVFDFIFAGVLLFGTGLAYEFISKKGSTLAYRAATGIAVGTSLLLVWINLAVGIIGNEDNPANVLYFGVLLIGLIGTIMSRLNASGMSRTLFAVAAAQVAVPIIAVIVWQPDFAPGVMRVFVLNAIFAVLWIVSGVLYRRGSVR